MSYPRGPVFFTGYLDPEMGGIEQLAQACGGQVHPLQYQGARVQQGDAYRADPDPNLAHLYASAFFVEGAVSGVARKRWQVVDHHREGDPGDLPPEYFWEASSIGRVATIFGVAPTIELLEEAARDHCFAAEQEGFCPGTNPERTRAGKVQHIANTTGTTPDVVEEVAEDFRKDEILSADTLFIGDRPVRDLRHVQLGPSSSREFLAMQVGLVDERAAGLVTSRNTADGRALIQLTGSARPEQVIDFKTSWAPQHGLQGIFGMPNRWYGGGYLLPSATT